ncbi:translation initiation factor IF-2-like [Herpailurus yagouaroundi]|uniref:translation initiation factor IF-2-like n=1 Tax=Herpailurus yagouaroundi TaxID=1608482 RepID=UPI001AD772E8|nr:translation initiation factor IF-2-like [Puma yagouaroundi]
MRHRFAARNQKQVLKQNPVQETFGAALFTSAASADSRSHTDERALVTTLRYGKATRHRKPPIRPAIPRAERRYRVVALERCRLETSGQLAFYTASRHIAPYPALSDRIQPHPTASSRARPLPAAHARPRPVRESAAEAQHACEEEPSRVVQWPEPGPLPHCLSRVDVLREPRGAPPAGGPLLAAPGRVRPDLPSGRHPVPDGQGPGAGRHRGPEQRQEAHHPGCRGHGGPQPPAAQRLLPVHHHLPGGPGLELAVPRDVGSGGRQAYSWPGWAPAGLVPQAVTDSQ